MSMRRVAWPVVAAIAAAALSACGADPDDARTTAAPTATTPASTMTSASTTTTTAEPEIVIPPGILAAMPFQNRLDVAQGIFQVKLYNGTSQDFDVVGVQLLWDGLTTPVSDRANPLIAGDRLDYPVLLAPASCVGDGTVADMPDPQKAVVRVLLADGSEVRAPVFDVKHFARKLYLADCQRQFIAAQVGIEWVDLHAATLDGRPVTEGSLRLTRLAGTGEITVQLISNTIVFDFTAPEAGNGPIAVLPRGQHTVAVPIRFVEGRCDTHAMAEASQPFAFASALDLGDGVQRSYALPIPVADQVPMRTRLEAGCAFLGKTVVLGQGPVGAATTTTGG